MQLFGWKCRYNCKGEFMALPIAATPILEGDDAKRFYERMDEDAKKGVSREEVLEGMRIFKAIMDRNPEMKRRFGIS
jgi:hypothetical protein